MSDQSRVDEYRPRPIDLAPAQWIWLPSRRTLANTFVLFRREIEIREGLVRADGWISADSRYRVTVNGQRIQWGPAPADPRWPDVDPLDLTPCLQPGPAVIGIEVLYYGHGDGTWPLGKPGLICRLDLLYDNGRKDQLVTDESWLCAVDRAHPPGQHKRWYLRALQEVFDARGRPEGWDSPDFAPDGRWRRAAAIGCPTDKPPICSAYPDYLSDAGAPPGPQAWLLTRQIPLLRETPIPAMRLADAGRVHWRTDPEDWFQFRIPDSFDIRREPVAREVGQGAWELPATLGGDAVFATFELKEQVVGWPYFTIDAPEGTIVEVMVQESHDPETVLWLDSHFYAWSRIICREGLNRFECFDYESLRWIQLHIRSASRPVIISGVGVRRRLYPWPYEPRIHVGEPALDRLVSATLNTLYNSAQETIVDGMGRERQQYSGDCGHQLHAIRYAFGDALLARRYLRSFSEGQTPGGYFLDCWPAYDRLARVAERMVGVTGWGPLLDHGVGFVFDCWNHYVETGDLEALREPYPRLLRFADYLAKLRQERGDNGLLPVENLGVPSVWIDHQAYQRQRHKQCAFNLYAAAMLRFALSPIAEAFGDLASSARAQALGREIEQAAVRRFWSREAGLFVNNLPWIGEEGGARLCDRSLATSILFGQCPGDAIGPSMRALAKVPPEMGLSYPANAGWRYCALAEGGRADVVISDMRSRWATMPSVRLNNTVQEMWQVRPDSGDEWSHCAAAPVYALFMSIAGIRATAPGFARCTIRPQLADLPALELTANTVRGPIQFSGTREERGHVVKLTLPKDCEGELLLPPNSHPGLTRLMPDSARGLARFEIPQRREVSVHVPAPSP